MAERHRLSSGMLQMSGQDQTWLQTPTCTEDFALAQSKLTAHYMAPHHPSPWDMTMELGTPTSIAWYILTEPLCCLVQAQQPSPDGSPKLGGASVRPGHTAETFISRTPSSFAAVWRRSFPFLTMSLLFLLSS